MRRAGKIVGIAAGVVIVLVAALFAWANTGAGMRMLAALTPTLTGGQLEVSGLSGRFPDRLRVAHGELRDDAGVWATFDHAAIDWDPLKLISGEARIDSLTVAHLDLRRLPRQQAGASQSNLPVRVHIARWRVDRVDIAPALAHLRAALSAHGAAHLTEAGGLSGTASLRRLDGPGAYHVDFSADPARVSVHVTVSEPKHGLISELAGLPELGAIALTLSLEGPRDAERLQLSGSAGPLTAAAHGTLDLAAKTAALDVAIKAPAMQPRADLGWQGVAAALTIKGAFGKPDVTGTLHVDGPRFGEVTARRIDVVASGNQGEIGATGTVEGLVVPGPSPDLFTAAPLRFTAKALLGGKAPALHFSASHPLLAVSGKATINGSTAITGSARITVPKLAPFAALTHTDLRGHAAIDADIVRDGAATKVTAHGDLAVTGGVPPAAALIGGAGTLDLSATLKDGAVAITRADLSGKAVSASVTGTARPDKLDLGWQFDLPDLSRVAANLKGKLKARGRISGAMTDLGVTASLDGALGTRRVASGPIAATVEVHGLPTAPEGKATVTGRIAGAPLDIALTAKRAADGTVRVAIAKAGWKGASAKGNLVLPAGATLPEGKIDLRLRLADFNAFVARPLAGTIEAALDLKRQAGRPTARVAAQGQGLAFGDTRLERATLDGSIADFTARKPRASLRATLKGIALANADGDADVSATGTLDALAVKLSSRWHTTATPATTVTLSAAALLDAPKRNLRLTAFDVSAQGERARLLAPARFDFAKGIAVDRLRLGVAKAVVQVEGRLAPTLDVTASARNVTPALARPFLPGIEASGGLRAEGRLVGTLAAPRGTIRVTGTKLALGGAMTGGFPAASFDATARLDGTTARLDAKFDAGKSVALTASGRLPLTATGALDVKAKGRLDLAMLDPILAAEGRRLRGKVDFDLAVAGTAAAPRIDGSATLTQGEIQDYVRGLHITKLKGRITATNGVLRLIDVGGHAGPGTVAVNGTIDLTRRTMPVDLKITAKHAKPLQSDLLTAEIDAAMTLKGALAGRLDLGGTIFVRRANINIPDQFPETVAVLQVRRSGKPAEAATAPRFNPNLALTIKAPQQVFVRGHGLDAELGGTMTIGGTAENPKVTGALSMRRGTFSLAGQTLTFTSGTITFDQTNLARKIDPALNFVATTTANNVTATLTVTGYADAPVISLTSSPSMPADQIMAQLLFGSNVSQLSALQAASVAQGLASLSGIGGGAGGTLSDIRQRLGLDRLSVGSDTKGTGAAIEAGRYVARGVYVGAKQGISGGTQAQVQIDITKHLKAQTTLGTGNGTPVTGITPQNDPGNSVGITYQFEY